MILRPGPVDEVELTPGSFFWAASTLSGRRSRERQAGGHGGAPKGPRGLENPAASPLPQPVFPLQPTARVDDWDQRRDESAVVRYSVLFEAAPTILGLILPFSLLFFLFGFIIVLGISRVIFEGSFISSC